MPLFLMAYRAAVHRTTGISPAKMTFGRNIRLPADIVFGKPEEPKKSAFDYVAHCTARKNIAVSSYQAKARYDRQANVNCFKEGGQVWLYNPQRKKVRSPKLQKDWEGPY